MIRPTRQLVENGTIREGQHHDFKEQLNVDTDHGKAKFIDQVVAFLNAGGGHLIVGVKEKAGVCEALRPLVGDSHAWAERIRSLVTQHVNPVPNAIETHAIDVDGGYLLDIRIPEHRMQPYQNRLTGGFYVRTDRQNRPIGRDEIQAFFKGVDDYRTDLKRLASVENARLAARGAMLDDGPILEVSILPREHYDGHAPFSYRKGPVIRSGPGYPHHGAGHARFVACEDGSEATEATSSGKLISRFFVSADWFVHATVAYPFRCTEGEGRVTIHEMKAQVQAYLTDVVALLDDAGVHGPFAVLFRFSHLHRDGNIGWIFHFDGPVTFEPRGLVEVLEPQALAKGAYEAIADTSKYR